MRVGGDRPEWQQQQAEKQLDCTWMLRVQLSESPDSPEMVSEEQEAKPTPQTLLRGGNGGRQESEL